MNQLKELCTKHVSTCPDRGGADSRLAMSSIIRLSSPSHQISIKPLNSNPATVSCPMFCSSLRTRPLWNTLRPLIAASSPWKLQESTLETHDFAIQMLSGNHESYLTVLVVCPADMIDAGLSDTTARLQRFAATTKGPASVIVFILDDKQGALASKRFFLRLVSYALLSQFQTVLFSSRHYTTTWEEYNHAQN